MHAVPPCCADKCLYLAFHLANLLSSVHINSVNLTLALSPNWYYSSCLLTLACLQILIFLAFVGFMGFIVNKILNFETERDKKKAAKKAEKEERKSASKKGNSKKAD